MKLPWIAGIVAMALPAVAQAHWHGGWGFRFGIPLPRVYVAPYCNSYYAPEPNCYVPPVVSIPAPVYAAPPIVYDAPAVVYGSPYFGGYSYGWGGHYGEHYPHHHYYHRR